jgi:predicted DCC family thiol-disulfide oxidoreductase YuxK
VRRKIGVVAHLIFYDGVCGLCDRWVQVVMAHDAADRFCFAPLQGKLAAELLGRYGRSASDLDTVYVVTDHRQAGEALLWRGRAVVFVLRRLDGPWGLVGRLLALFPAGLADRGYRFIAARRYRWFGRFESCRLPDARQRAKFLEDPAPQA